MEALHALAAPTPGADDCGATRAGDELEAIVAALEELGAEALSESALRSMVNDDVLPMAMLVKHAGRLIDSLRVRLASAIDKRSQPHLGEHGLATSNGFRRPADLIEHTTGVSAREARRRIRMAHAVTPRESDVGLPLPALFPVVGDALERGDLGVDAAEAIVSELSVAAPRAEIETLQAAEQCLVDAAAHSGSRTRDSDSSPVSADLVRVQARLWRDALDPDGVEPRAEDAISRRDLRISRHANNGLHAITGQLTSDVAARALAIFDACITPRSAPKFVSDLELAGDEARRDPRTPGQQRADVFAAMVESFAGNTEFHTPPAVVITATGSPDGEVTASSGAMTGVTEPIPASLVRQLQCNGGTQIARTDEYGAVVSLSTTQRLFTTSQRRAIVARDGHECLGTGCRIPATGCEAHHVVPWQNGGRTHVANGVLLCWWHHRQIDTGALRITMHNGVPRIEPPACVGERRRQ